MLFLCRENHSFISIKEWAFALIKKSDMSGLLSHILKKRKYVNNSKFIQTTRLSIVRPPPNGKKQKANSGKIHIDLEASATINREKWVSFDDGVSSSSQ